MVEVRPWRQRWRRRHAVPWTCAVCGKGGNEYTQERCAQCARVGSPRSRPVIGDAAATLVQASWRGWTARHRSWPALLRKSVAKRFDGDSTYYAHVKTSRRLVLLRGLAGVEMLPADEADMRQQLAKQKSRRRLALAFQEREQQRAEGRQERQAAGELAALDAVQRTWAAPLLGAERNGELIANWLKLTEIDARVFDLGERLRLVRFTGNPLGHVPDALFPSIPHVVTLSLSNCDLESLPDSLACLTALEDLNLMQNRLTRLPERFGDLGALTALHLSSNKLEALPESFGQLVRLPRLDLEQNCLESLPASMVRLRCSRLNLGKLRLTQLPRNLGDFGMTLVSLSADGNRLRRLPKSIGQLRNLKRLSLCTNQLRHLPDELCQLRSLEQLLLNWNLLEELPADFLELGRLGFLQLEGNPMKLPEMDVVVQGVPAVRRWFAGNVHLYVARERKEIVQRLQTLLATLYDEGLHDPALHEAGFKLEARYLPTPAAQAARPGSLSLEDVDAGAAGADMGAAGAEEKGTEGKGVEEKSVEEKSVEERRAGAESSDWDSDEDEDENEDEDGGAGEGGREEKEEEEEETVVEYAHGGALFHAIVPSYLFSHAIPAWNRLVDEMSAEPDAAREKLAEYSLRKTSAERRDALEQELSESLIADELDSVEESMARGNSLVDSGDDSSDDSDDDDDNEKVGSDGEEKTGGGEASAATGASGSEAFDGDGSSNSKMLNQKKQTKEKKKKKKEEEAKGGKKGNDEEDEVGAEEEARGILDGSTATAAGSEALDAEGELDQARKLDLVKELRRAQRAKAADGTPAETLRLRAARHALALVPRSLEPFDNTEEEVWDALRHCTDSYGGLYVPGVPGATFKRCKCSRGGEKRLCVPPDMHFSCTREAGFLRVGMATYLGKMRRDSEAREAAALRRRSRAATKAGRRYARSPEGASFFDVVARREAVRVLEAERQERFVFKQRGALERARRDQKARSDAHKESLKSARKQRATELGKARFRLVAKLERARGWEAQKLQEAIDDVDDELANPPQDQDLELLAEDEDRAAAKARKLRRRAEVLRGYRPEGALAAALREQWGGRHVARAAQVRKALVDAHVHSKVRQAVFEVRREYRLTRKIMFNWMNLNVRATFVSWRQWVRYERYWRRQLQAEAEQQALIEQANSDAEHVYQAAEFAKWGEQVDRFSDRKYWQHAETGDVVWEQPRLEDCEYVKRA